MKKFYKRFVWWGIWLIVSFSIYVWGIFFGSDALEMIPAWAAFFVGTLVGCVAMAAVLVISRRIEEF